MKGASASVGAFFMRNPAATMRTGRVSLSALIAETVAVTSGGASSAGRALATSSN